MNICPGASITRIFGKTLCGKCLTVIEPLLMVQTTLFEEVKQAEMFAYFDEIAASRNK